MFGICVGRDSEGGDIAYPLDWILALYRLCKKIVVLELFRRFLEHRKRFIECHR